MEHNTSVLVAYVLFTYPQCIVEKQVSHLSLEGRIRDKKDFVKPIEITRKRVMFEKFLANGKIAW